MRLLIISDRACDIIGVLSSAADAVVMSFDEALHADISQYDSYAVIGEGKIVDARLRLRLENETENGKKALLVNVTSYYDIYSSGGENTVRSRLVVVDSTIDGLEIGDILDEESNSTNQPYYSTPNEKPLLVYKKRIIAHRHVDGTAEELEKDSRKGIWTVGSNVMMTSFRMENFNKARFAPRESWKKLIFFITEWLTGKKPSFYPEAVCRYGADEEVTDENFDRLRNAAVRRSIEWLERFVIDEGRGGIMEGLAHNVAPDGSQKVLTGIRADCTGEAAGAFMFYGKLTGRNTEEALADAMQDFNYTVMTVHGGIFDGMLRWTDSAWGACYQDDVARAVLPTIYMKYFFGEDKYYPAVENILDFLVKTTAKDGTRKSRTDRVYLDADKVKSLAQEEASGCLSAHYNAYYHAALLLAYECSGKREYLETGRKGLESLMKVYPDTHREQSETEEMARLVLPLALLYGITGEERHLEMLHRVTDDLEAHRHESGAVLEWDTGYKAECSRESLGECSILTENGDPVVDLLYSSNWLPIGYAFAYKTTGEERYIRSWRDIVKFMISSQIISKNEMLDGAWTRAFDVELKEAYAAPHDAGWATYACETGWTVSEIAMGMMLPKIMELSEK